MRYYSIFSGIEAASVAWGPIGWEPLVFSENDEFPCAVLAERYPDVPNLGDITEIDWKKTVKSYGKPDVVVGGSPCQSFSIAGTRTGLDGASGLMWEYVRCVRELMPRWLLWENVPGALSSSHGEDFRCLLEALDALGYGLAWRVLDAQFFGVAQRRERVYLVGCLGDPGRACQVLFEPESLSWDSPSSREKRKELAARAGIGAGGAGGALNPADPQSKRVFDPEGPAPTLSSGTGEGMNIQPSVLCAGFRWNAGGKTALSVDETSPTVTSSDPPAVCAGFKYHQGAGAGNIGYEPEQSPTLTADYHNPAVLCMTDTQSHSMVDGELCGALSSTMHKDPPVVGFAANQRGEVRLQGGDGSTCGAIPASQSGKQVQGVTDEYAVRRLTPRECERLQGFPDDWTKVPYRGKAADECPDTPRYKAIGNSMAVPVMRWIGRRIDAADRTEEHA